MTRTRGGDATCANDSTPYPASSPNAVTSWIAHNVPATARNAIDHKCGQAYAGAILGGLIGVIGGGSALLILGARWALNNH